MLDRFVESAVRKAFRTVAAATVLTQGFLAMAASQCSYDNAKELASLIANQTAEYFKEASNLAFYDHNGISTVQVQKPAQMGSIKFYPHLEADSVIQEANNCSLLTTKEVSCQVREGIKTCVNALIDRSVNYLTNGTTVEEITKVVLDHAVGRSWSTTTDPTTESNAVSGKVSLALNATNGTTESNASLWSNTVTAAVNGTVNWALNATTASPSSTEHNIEKQHDDGPSAEEVAAFVGGAIIFLAGAGLITGLITYCYHKRNPSSQVGDAEQQTMIGMNPSSQVGDAEVDEGGFAPIIARS